MNKIIFPLTLRRQGPEVGELQAALALILERKAILATDETTRLELAVALKHEHAEQTYGNATFKVVSVFQKQIRLEVLGEVDEPTANALNRLVKELGTLDETSVEEFVVRGNVTLANGVPGAGFIVRARDRDLRTFESLGNETHTDSDGRYEIHYSKGEFSRTEKGNADLVVRVFSPDNHDSDKPVVESPTMFNAPPVAEINLQVPELGITRSEFERHVEAIAPLRAGQDEGGGDLLMGALTEPDIDFLSGDTGIDRKHIAWLVQAALCEEKSKSVDPAIRARVSYRSVPQALFYGWFREGVTDKWEQLSEQSIAALRTAARAAIAHGIIPAELEASIEPSLDAMPNPRRDALRAAVTTAGLSQEALGTIFQYAGTVEEINNPLVSRLVDEGKIARSDAHRIGLGAAVHSLVDGHEPTMAAILHGKPARWNGRGLQRARDLAALDAADIEKALGDANVKPSDGITLPGYVARLAGQIAEMFPTDGLLHRVTNVSDEIVAAVERVFDDSADSSPEIENSRFKNDPELRAFINLHPGMKLGELVDQARDASAAVEELKQRVAWVDRVHELNSDLDLLAVDYLPGSDSLKQVKFDGLSDAARSMVVANLKAYQRIQSSNAGAIHAIELLKAGYRSNTAVARSLPAEIAERTGLPLADVRVYHAQAELHATDAALAWFAFHDLERDTRIYKHRSLLSAPEYLKQLAGYDQLFGSPNFCHCEHCQSVLGPAAYFVDLMYFVERHILKSFTAHGGEQNSLHLRSRRADLYSKLELSCDNTNKIVPSLDLVIEILESFIVREKGLASVAQLYEQLAGVDYSIRLPFSLPLERLSIWLSHLKISRSEVARAFLLRDTDAAARARIRLGMLPKQSLIISTSRLGDLSAPPILAAQNFFSVWLNAKQLTFSTLPGETETLIISPVNVLAFSRGPALDRTAVNSILTGDFVNAATPGAPARIYLEAGIGTAGGVQNDMEVVRNLTAGRLDRFERFVRLWRHVPWTSAELEYVIGRLQKSATTNATISLDETMLVALASLLDMQEQLQLPVDELCALWDDVPPNVLRSGLSLFDRAFNQPPFHRQGQWPDATQLINASSSVRARLLAALQINDRDLTLLEDALDVCLGGINVAVANIKNLSLLYRYARLARALKLSIEELLETVTLTASIISRTAANERRISSLTDLQAVLEVHGWRASSGFSLPEMLFVTEGVSSLPGYEDPDVLAAAIADEVAAEKTLYISPDLFTQVGLTQSDSAELIIDNTEPVGATSTLLELVPGDQAYRIKRTIGIDDVATSFLFDPQPRAARVTEVAGDIYAIVTLNGTSGFETTDLEALGLATAEAGAFVQANVSVIATDGKPFEQMGTTSFYRLRTGISKEAAITRFGTEPEDVTATRRILLYRARDLVVRNYAGVAQEVYRIVKRGGKEGFQPSALVELGLSATEANAFVLAHVSGATSDGKPFEAVPGSPNHYRLRVAISEAVAIAAFGINPQDFAATKSILRYRCLDVVLRHHTETVLAAKAATAVRMPPEKTVALLNLALPSSAADRQALADALQGGSLQILSTVLERLTRYAVLFKSAAYDSQALEFVRANAAVLAFSEPLTAETVRRVSIYAALAATPDQAYQPDAPTIDASTLQSVLMWTASIANAITDTRWTQVALALRTGAPRQAPKMIAGATWATGTATYTSAAHGYAVGDTVEVADVTPAGYNVPAGLVTSATTNSFGVAVTSDPGTYGSGGTARRFTEEIKAILSAMRLASGTSVAPRVDELSQLASALVLTRRLGVAAEILKLIVSENHAELTEGAEGVFGAIRAKYSDEKTFHAKLEPFEDKLRSRNRDGLVEYLLSAPDDATTDWRHRFASANDLYYHFLTDVMVEGCARTSRVVAAISSVQLYVHRVLMNLEGSEDGILVVAFDDPSRQEEWKWRKNYQVWVANRKVFLYPENYIEPSLRDDKTPLFKELEDALLQQQITEQNVLEAYAQYLHGFEEVSRLRIAGAYHDRRYDDKQKPVGDLLHLFGVTTSDPPIYYYRTIRDLDNSKGPVFSAWEKLDLQIPTRKVSPIIYLGRLYVFWVETTTRQLSDFNTGSSEFNGYRHSVRTKFSQLRLDGRWTPPQTIKTLDDFGAAADVRLVEDAFSLIVIPSINAKNPPPGYKRVLWDTRQRDHTKPIENYAPEGWLWERVYPDIRVLGVKSDLVVRFSPRNDKATSLPEIVDFWTGTALSDPTPIGQQAYPRLTIVDRQPGGAARLFQMGFNINDGPPFHFATECLNEYEPFIQQGQVIGIGPLVQLPPRSDLQVLNGNVSSVLLEPPGESLLLLAALDGSGFTLRNLGTSLTRVIGTKVVAAGVSGLLDTEFQESKEMKEASSAASIPSGNAKVTPIYFSTTSTRAEWNDKEGTFLPYFREVFFQIPFLVADYLNSQQKFADSQRWYHYLYDPTASEPSADEKKRPWRYREFREQPIWSLRKALTDANSLAAYRQDPFNPHAIARLRPGAYQKAIFMKYIDNLLDWGDSLFSQFTMESVNEATMLYVMAADILGPRPTELGPCGETSGSGKTYDKIARLLRPKDEDAEPTTDFLIEESENFTLALKDFELKDRFVVLSGRGRMTISQAATAAGASAPAGGEGIATLEGGNTPAFDLGAPNPAGWNQTGATLWKEDVGPTMADLHSAKPLGGAPVTVLGGQATPRLPLAGDAAGPINGSLGNIPQPRFPKNPGGPNGFSVDDYLADVKYDLRDAPPQHVPPRDKKPPAAKLFELMHARLVFCIPENKELGGYWDRVEDRLNKIRNCMDMAGVRRRLELFAPEIDPRMLVRMRAAGLSLDDVLNVTSGNLPPYRFSYLIEKAKQHAGLVQSFGNQVLSALEKRDGEELLRLRTVHEQNLLKLRSQMTQWEIDAAEDTIASLASQKAAVLYRQEYFSSLSTAGLLPPESASQQLQLKAAGFRTMAAISQVVASVVSIVPDLGAPTAMKFGGTQLGNACRSMAESFSAASAFTEMGASMAGAMGSNLRREQDWRHQAETAKRELAQLDKQIAAAEIRRDIAQQSLTVHDRSVEQVKEIFDFLRDRFTNFGRFTWLSAELQKLHRMAFNAALGMARLAEQACKFEHPDEAVQPGLSGDYWDAGNAGLLAGDRLMLDLHNLERRYIETHHRTLEIEQSFSLARFDPDALRKLQTECACDFEIPEWFFDLTYPGHYRRRIKAVRLTIPCVVGPHTNIGATLRLTGSHIRKEAKLESTVSVPLRHMTAIAASMGQSDAGVFEFSFQDERYMPFEGAGVNSQWQLRLPSSVKPFDYGSISDVILHLSYTADESQELRETAEAATGVITKLTEIGITRIFNLRHDFPNAWHALISGAAQTEIEISDVHLPFIMSGVELEPGTFEILTDKLSGSGAVYPAITFHDIAVTEADSDSESGLYRIGRAGPVDVVAKHVIKITALGTATLPGVAGGPQRLDSSKIKDILLRVAVRKLASPVRT